MCVRTGPGWGKILQLALLAAFLAAGGPASAQGPYVADLERFGRHGDNYTLRFCVDRREPGWQVDQAIGEAIAAALLIEPQVHVVEETAVQADFDRLYRHFLEDCSLYFGFKLIAAAYPPWLSLSRPYYEVGYRFVVKQPGWTSLADVPTTEALGPTIGTSADLRLVQYLQSLPADKRWRRFPMGTDEAALNAVVEGRVAAALVWEPSFSVMRASNPAFADLRTIDPDPLPTTRLPVGAAMLSQDAFLRNSVDEAIAALIADGTIEAILTEKNFSATVPQ
jgi:polar amino acid transport system substrate-binding protein